MTLNELGIHLNSLGYPLSYSHFKSAQKAPFITYIVTDVESFVADNKVLHELTHVDIELYVANKSPAIEAKIKNLLNELEVPWEYVENYIDSEGLFQCTFSITLI